jgi:hypothetical protein
VNPLAFGQYRKLGPGFEQLLDQLAEEGADEAAKRYLIPNRAVAKGVQLRLLRQRVVMRAQKAQADVLLHRLYYALPGWDAAAERRGAQGEFHSAAQARAWADGDFAKLTGVIRLGEPAPALPQSCSALYWWCSTHWIPNCQFGNPLTSTPPAL